MTNTLRLPSTYVEVSDNEMEYLDGGIGFLAGLVIGVIVGAVCEGTSIVTTGKGLGEWAAEGIRGIGRFFGRLFG